MGGQGTIVIPTRLLKAVSPTSGGGFVFPRVTVPNCRPFAMQTRLISSFSVPFLVAVGYNAAEHPNEFPIVPPLQLDIYRNGILVYSTALGVLVPETHIEGGGNFTVGWGLLSADLTNPISVNSSDNLEIGAHGPSPFRSAGITYEVLIALNLEQGGMTVLEAMAQVKEAELLGKSYGAGPGNLRFEEVDRYPKHKPIRIR